MLQRVFMYTFFYRASRKGFDVVRDITEEDYEKYAL